MKVIIFHGWGSSSKDNWFPYLADELKKKKVNVLVPDMPDSKEPKLGEWLKCAKDLKIEEDDILVGHSLGSVLILRLLEKYKVKAAYLVSSFHVDLGIKQIEEFTKKEFDFKKIKKNKVIMLSSDDDPYIRLSIAEELSKKLGCRLMVFHDKEHLSAGTVSHEDTDNFKFPELLALIDEDI